MAIADYPFKVRTFIANVTLCLYNVHNESHLREIIYLQWNDIQIELQSHLRLA